MTLEELQDLVEKDMKLNDTELDLESLKTPQLHNKYMKHLNNFRLLLSRAEAELITTQRDKWEYYTGKSDQQTYIDNPFNLKVLKQDVDQYIKSDVEYVKAKQKVDYLSTIVDYLDKTLRQISSRDWQIRNAIEWRKFTSGAI